MTDIQHLTPDDGLANLLTQVIFKDQDGFMWIGTQYGLNRYDGYRFELFTKAKNGLQRNDGLSHIAEDDEGLLWLFYLDKSNGLWVDAVDIFDRTTRKSVSFQAVFQGGTPFEPNDLLALNISDPKKRLWFTTRDGYIYRYENGAFQKVFYEKNTNIRRLIVDAADNIWLIADAKLLCLSMDGKILSTHSIPHKVNEYWLTDKNQVFIQTSDVNKEKHTFRLWELNKEENKLSPVSLNGKSGPFYNELGSSKLGYCRSDGFWFLKIDKNGICSDHINAYDPDGNWLFQYGSRSEGNTNLTDFLEDKAAVWCSTPTGLLKLSLKPNPFMSIHTKEGFSDCRGIAEGYDSTIYFINKGLWQYFPQEQTATSLATGIGAYPLLFMDSILWTASYGYEGGGEYNISTKQVRFYNSDKIKTITSVLKSDKHNLLIAGQNDGLSYVDIGEKSVLPFRSYGAFQELKNTQVNWLHKTEKGIWLATASGLYLMDAKEQVVAHFDKASGHLPFDVIQHIYEDSEGAFWLSTKGGGIIRWLPPNEKGSGWEMAKYLQFTSEDGLSNNYTYAVYEDDFGDLWIPSDMGIMQMDKETYRIKTYLEEDGLLHNEFNQSSHFKASDGRLYFGGLGGLISFDPANFQEEAKNKTPLIFTQCNLLEEGEEKMTNRADVIQQATGITLKPTDKLLEVEFAILDFERPEQHSYAYRIEGFTDYWSNINENYLRITNLPAGDYTLQVRGKHSSLGWSEQELSLPIHVLKPFYLRTWFLALLTAALIGFIYFTIKRRESRLRTDRERLEREVENRTRQIELDKKTIEKQAEDLKTLDKAKTRFFSNITHEFRTPLTLISGPMEQTLQEDLPSYMHQRAKGVLKNSKQLMGLINQLLDLSKLESGQMQMEIAHGDIIGYTKELVQRFRPLAQKKAQNLTFESNIGLWETHFDEGKWNKIVYNLLSNALKFTPKGGSITLFLYKKESPGNKEALQLIVQDTGVGMTAEDVERIFDRFYQADASSTREQEGTGIGLALVKELVEMQGGSLTVESELGEGTTFEVNLPIPEMSDTVFPLVGPKEILPELSFSDIEKAEDLKPEAPVEPIDDSEKLEVLLIEDNEEMRAYIRSSIDENRYKIHEASNGEEGITSALKTIPDVIVSDVMMPKKNGYEVVETIRADVRTSHIPIVLLTAKASLESRLQGLARGADAYLTKPFSPAELTLRIKKLIELRLMLQQRYSGKPLNAAAPIFKKEDAFIQELRDYIRANMEQENLNGDFIGAHFNISRMQLHRKIKALTGEAISVFVRNERLALALELIQENKFTLSEVAYKTGFTSLSSFSSSFKKIYGKAPSKF